jgi:D-3-phosphoglycerate dehydrogenase / 2-oxoglutarate reductase
VLRDERPAGMADHPLVRHAREHRNLLITPHIGGATSESMAKTERFLADRLAAILEDGR